MSGNIGKKVHGLDQLSSRMGKKTSMSVGGGERGNKGVIEGGYGMGVTWC